MANKSNKLLRRLRIQEGLSQTELAEKLGVNQPYVSNWERGKKSPSDKVREKLNIILGVQSDFELPSTPVGTWLTKARTEKKLSVAELANLSKLALPTIYNIEAGKSPNPHKSTIDALQEALDSKIPPDVAKEIKSDATIKGIGELIDFDPYDVKNLPKESGVYVFYDISERPVYVGESEKISSRVTDHEEKFWFKRPIVEKGSYIVIKKDRLRQKIEKVLVKFLKSNAVLNKQHVER